jgi:peptide/nickel transport system substrate-binding protein
MEEPGKAAARLRRGRDFAGRSVSITRHRTRASRVLAFRTRAIAASALAVCIGLFVLSGSATAKSGATLTIGYSVAPNSLNPISSADYFVTDIAYEHLININTNDAAVPGLATKWGFLKGAGIPTNQDFELTLRHNARFSDGTPVTAKAVVNWLKYFASSTAQAVSFVPKIASITAIGQWTVRMNLTAPQPELPEVFGYATEGFWGAVASPAAVANPSEMNTGTYGAGPYTLDASQTVAGDTYTYVPNPYFYDKSQIHWAKIVIKVIPTASSMLDAIETGQVNVAQGDPTTVAAAAYQGLKVDVGPGTTPLVLLDVKGDTDPALADVRVRQAMNYAVNRRQLASALFGKYGSATDEIAVVDGQTAKYANYYGYNPAKAKALLAAAGYPNGLTINMTYDAYDNVDGPLTQAIASQLAAVGITLNLNPVEQTSTYLADVLGTTPPPMFVAAAGYDTTQTYYGLFFKAGGLLNHSGGGFSDPVINGLVTKALTAANPTPDWQGIVARVVTQAYVLATVHAPVLWYTTSSIGGVSLGKIAEAVDPTSWFDK